MTADDLRAIMSYLRGKVQLDSSNLKNPFQILFNAPTNEEMIEATLNEEGSRLILTAPWWADMMTDIVETPDFCEPDDSPEQVLEYARDVVSDYLRKRVSL